MSVLCGKWYKKLGTCLKYCKSGLYASFMINVINSTISLKLPQFFFFVIKKFIAVMTHCLVAYN